MLSGALGVCAWIAHNVFGVHGAYGAMAGLVLAQIANLVADAIRDSRKPKDQ